MIATRIRVIIEFKKHETFGISKRAVAEAVGVNHNSVQTWRTLYEQGGIAAILKHDRKDGRPSNITSNEHKLIEQKLKDPNNGLRRYVELLSWVEEEFKKSIKYNTLLKYATRHFGSKVKVARKSHVKKDDEAVITFKKTLVNSAKKSSSYKEKYKTINLYFQDESRFGLFTKNGKALTAKGVKPICPFQ
jgi:transposase